jgi:hypothetical protein
MSRQLLRICPKHRVPEIGLIIFVRVLRKGLIMNNGGRDRKGGVRAARRLAGACGAAGAFLAFGMTPAGIAPPANADFGLDDLFDLIDPNLVAVLGDAGSAAAAPAADPSTLVDAFQQDFWLPLHTDLQDWINSPLGTEIDNNVINPLFAPLTQALNAVFAPGAEGYCGIICDGLPGTEADPTGQGGGFWFGDGGAGYDAVNDPGMAGGNGGAAGGWGDGGNGGDGGYGANGGLGGAGGEGYGNGGNGGDGGDGGGYLSSVNALLGPGNGGADGYLSSVDALVTPGNGGAGGPTGNAQDFLGFFADGNGGTGGMGGTGYYVDGGTGGPGGDGSLFISTGGTGGAGGDAIGGTLGSAGSAPTGDIGGPGGAGGTIDEDE